MSAVPHDVSRCCAAAMSIIRRQPRNDALWRAMIRTVLSAGKSRIVSFNICSACETSARAKRAGARRLTSASVLPDPLCLVRPAAERVAPLVGRFKELVTEPAGLALLYCCGGDLQEGVGTEDDFRAACWPVEVSGNARQAFSAPSSMCNDVMSRHFNEVVIR